MKVLEVRNVNEAVAQGFKYLVEYGIQEDSRNGKVLVAPGPVATVYKNPTERVLFSPLRDANPFFHLMESLWMLAGRNDVAFPAVFNKRFHEYSDDGVRQHGAYGFRWRNFWGFDQLQEIVALLRGNPDSRRAVLGMWSPAGDLVPITTFTLEGEQGLAGGPKSKDVPCNTQAYFDLRGGKLNMTVCNRSNDIVWGAYGANVVHFSMLLEYLAGWLDVPVGEYIQFSNNYHAYTDVYSADKLMAIAAEAANIDLYRESGQTGKAAAVPLKMFDINGEHGIKLWNADLINFLDPEHKGGYVNSFFADVALPMLRAWIARKGGRSGVEEIDEMPMSDWKIAALSWISRRERNKAQ